MQKIRLLLLSLSTVLSFAVPALVTSSAYATFNSTNISNNLCSGSNGDLAANAAAPANECIAAGNTANNLVATIINIISVVVGIVAVIMIIYAGFRYVTSGGKDDSVKGAKNTILYAVIGLVVVALAQIIVHFVLSKTSQAAAGA
jgi:beta-lactamase regulating signal transducer with metallopeptidase domain